MPFAPTVAGVVNNGSLIQIFGETPRRLQSQDHSQQGFNTLTFTDGSSVKLKSTSTVWIVMETNDGPERLAELMRF